MVPPQNPLTRLMPNEVRQIFSGAITDWAGRRAARPHRTLLPDGASDEAERLIKHCSPAQRQSARRLASSGNVVRAVVGASGLRTIGLVAFSAAVPAKVLKLGAAPAPSTLSIGDQRYPLSVAIVVKSMRRRAAPPARWRATRAPMPRSRSSRATVSMPKKRPLNA